jgi:hypothetical protein
MCEKIFMPIGWLTTAQTLWTHWSTLCAGVPNAFGGIPTCPSRSCSIADFSTGSKLCHSVIQNSIKVSVVVCCVMLLAAIVSADITSNLQGYWKLDGDYIDCSGNGRDLTSIGTVNPTPSTEGKFNSCYEFDNISNPVQLLCTAVPISGTNGVTMTCWVNPSVLESGVTPTAPHTALKVHSLYAPVTKLDFRIINGVLGPYWHVPAQNIYSTFAVPTDTWTFIAVTHDGSMTLKIYMNDSSPQSFSVGSPQAYNLLYVGASNNLVDTPRGLKGKIDEVRLYDRALSDADILEVYNYSPPAPTPTPIPTPVSDSFVQNGGFEIGNPLPSFWDFEGGGQNWGIDYENRAEGKRSVVLSLPASNGRSGYTSARLEILTAGFAGEIVRASCYIKTENIKPLNNYRAYVSFTGHHFDEILGEFAETSSFTYLESEFVVPPDAPRVTITLRGFGGSGKVWFDDIKLTLASSAPFIPTVVWRESSQGLPWTSDRSYRVIGEIDQAESDDPIWANLDTSRLLLRAGVREPVDNASVEVFAVALDGTCTQIPAILDSPLGTLANHYPIDVGVVKFRALSDIIQYIIYFDEASSSGVSMPAQDLNLGVGELFRYNNDQLSWVWGGWVGFLPVVADADKDGDWDLYLDSVDGGRFICRNIGTNLSPLFLPRSRPLPSDEVVPHSLSQPYDIDWDDDGDLDSLSFTVHSLGGYIEGAYATFQLQFRDGGNLGQKRDIKYLSGEIARLENASWVDLSVMDVDNDGKADILAGCANGFITLYLNRGIHNGYPIVEMSYLPVHGPPGAPVAVEHHAEDMALKPLPFDWDEDGDLDIIITGWQGFVFYLENFAQPNKISFRPAIKFYQKGGAVAVADSATPCAVDWDGDGDLDLICGGATGHIMLVENIGTRSNPIFKAGKFLYFDNNEMIHITAEETSGTIQGPFETYWGYLSAVATDWDLDSDLDLIINDSLGRLSWIENIGSRENPVLSHQIHRFRTEIPDIASDLMGYWKFENNYLDSSGNGNALESVGLGGDPTYSGDGIDGGCCIFNNSSVGNPQCLSGNILIPSSQGITISAWVNPTLLQDGFSNTAPHTIARMYNSSSSEVLDFRIRDKALDVYYTNPVMNIFSSLPQIPLNTWTFVAMTQYANVVKLYVNGELVWYGFVNGPQDYNRMIIGAPHPNVARGINGRMDEVRLYTRALSDSEISELFMPGGEHLVTTPWRNRPGVADWDGDGFSEIVVLDSVGRLVLYNQSAEGVSVLDKGTYLVDESGLPIVINSNRGSSLGRTQLDVGDWDGDGDFDILAGQPFSFLDFEANLLLCRNTGNNSNPKFDIVKMPARNKRFIEQKGSNGVPHWHSLSPEMADWNNDGDTDLIIGTESGRITYYEHSYFEGMAFPAWESLYFEKKESSGEIYRCNLRDEPLTSANYWYLYF